MKKNSHKAKNSNTNVFTNHFSYDIINANVIIRMLFGITECNGKEGLNE